MPRASLACWVLLCVFIACGPVPAANRFVVSSLTVCSGADDVEVLLSADLDQTIYGFSFGINYDETKLTVKSVTLDGTAIAPGAPDFYDGIIDTARGLVGYGCVLDFGPPFADAITAGTNKAITKLIVDVIGAPGSTQMILESVPTNPNPDRPVKNVMTNDQGNSIVPTLVPGTITIADCKPVIQTLSGNSGKAGKVFQVTGQHFGEPGRTVKVCGTDASATLRGDGVTLDVTAPACGSTGFQPIEVCNVYGCDSEANGFNYEVADEGGEQKPNDENQDGKFDLSDPVSVLGYLFQGTNPGLPCGDGSQSHPANIALLDSNGDGKIDLSDAVHMLSFLFSGGGVPAACAGDVTCPCKLIVDCPDNSAKCP